MPDEYDDLSELTDKLVASPQLLKAWRASSRIELAYAWYLLNHSWQLEPEIPRDYIPHNPRLRIWDDASGWNDHEPFTLTVFRGLEEPTLCRHAVWHCKRPGDAKRRLSEFFENDGQGQFREPLITVTDAEIPFEELSRHLQAIAKCSIPAITLQDHGAYSVTSDVASVGFEFFSQDQPPARIKYEWANDHRDWSCHQPREWQPLQKEVSILQDFLLACFK